MGRVYQVEGGRLVGWSAAHLVRGGTHTHVVAGTRGSSSLRVSRTWIIYLYRGEGGDEREGRIASRL